MPARVAAGSVDERLSLYIMSAGARAKGLHAAIVRESGWDNPHAVFPLLRALLDLAMVTMEVRRNPAYAMVVANDPATSRIGRRRKSPQALVHAGLKEMPDLAAAWDLLSEMGAHFGWAAFGMAMTVEHTEDAITVTASTGPGWNDPEMKLSSLRHSIQLARSVAGMLREIADLRAPDWE